MRPGAQENSRMRLVPRARMRAASRPNLTSKSTQASTPIPHFRMTSSPPVYTIDLHLQGTPNAVAAHVIAGFEGHIVIDCGPESTIPALLEGIRAVGLEPEEIRHIVLTHIHLDHAGAAGKLARMFGAQVYVHARGAPHLLDPSKLLASASKIFGARMRELWGGIESVPPSQLTVLEGARVPSTQSSSLLEAGGSDRPEDQNTLDQNLLDLSGHHLRAYHTPGHASHHLIYAWQTPEGLAVFAGDLAGVRLPGSKIPIPPTPPPEVDLWAWSESLELLRALEPSRLYLTHFGPIDDVREHLTGLKTNLIKVGALSLEAVQSGQSNRWLSVKLRAALGIAPAKAGSWSVGSMGEADAQGLERFWVKHHPELIPAAVSLQVRSRKRP
jgi:glyoxylase-like metal-dependent hydrolase (beta-lactamase superfamily II)